jgi:hypothetical protein
MSDHHVTHHASALAVLHRSPACSTPPVVSVDDATPGVGWSALVAPPTIPSPQRRTRLERSGSGESEGKQHETDKGHQDCALLRLLSPPCGLLRRLRQIGRDAQVCKRLVSAKNDEFC